VDKEAMVREYPMAADQVVAPVVVPQYPVVPPSFRSGSMVETRRAERAAHPVVVALVQLGPTRILAK
jgi:hypothetical protein